MCAQKSVFAQYNFYCVNTSYPMDNCFTGWRDQTPEKDVLYILPAGPVTECAFARWHIVLPSCLDRTLARVYRCKTSWCDLDLTLP